MATADCDGPMRLRRPWLFAFVTLLAAPASCTFDVSGLPADDDHPQQGDGSNEGTGDVADRCEGATPDSAGVCRSPNGQFAPKDCCTAECEAAVDDPMCIFGDSADEMELAVQLRIDSRRTVKRPDQLTKDQREQMVAGFASDGIAVGGILEAFKMIDLEIGVEVSKITYLPTGEAFDELRMRRGNADVGYVFFAKKTELAARIAGDAVSECTRMLPAELDPRCGPTAARCELVEADVKFCLEFEDHAQGCLDLVDFDEMVGCCEQIRDDFLFCEQILDR